jgi:hypothetical protein
VCAVLKDLFWKKYNGDGIRLLGAGLYNLRRGEGPEQLELFAEEKIKTRDLEKTILRLSKSGLSVKRASALSNKDKEEL